MNPHANPIEHPELRDPALADRLRRLKCTGYTTCLDVAERANWQSFACTSCTAFAPISREQERQDVEGFAALIEAMPRFEEAGIPQQNSTKKRVAGVGWTEVARLRLERRRLRLVQR